MKAPTVAENVANLRHNVEVAHVQGRSSIMLECHAAEWIAAELTRLAEVEKLLRRFVANEAFAARIDGDDCAVLGDAADVYLTELKAITVEARAALGAKDKGE